MGTAKDPAAGPLAAAALANATRPAIMTPAFQGPPATGQLTMARRGRGPMEVVTKRTRGPMIVRNVKEIKTATMTHQAGTISTALHGVMTAAQKAATTTASATATTPATAAAAVPPTITVTQVRRSCAMRRPCRRTTTTPGFFRATTRHRTGAQRCVHARARRGGGARLQLRQHHHGGRVRGVHGLQCAEYLHGIRLHRDR